MKEWTENRGEDIFLQEQFVLDRTLLPGLRSMRFVGPFDGTNSLIVAEDEGERRDVEMYILPDLQRLNFRVYSGFEIRLGETGYLVPHDAYEVIIKLWDSK